MRRPLRWAAAAGALAVVLAGGPQAFAALRYTTYNQPAQRVTSGSAAVVVQAGTTPATAPGAGWSIAPSLGTQYGVLTNIGTLPPQTATVSVSGLALGAVSACTIPWTTSGCSGTSASLNVGLPIAGTYLPGGMTWYLKVDALSLSVKFAVTNTSPAVSSARTNS